jgi:hypothetical protein
MAKLAIDLQRRTHGLGAFADDSQAEVVWWYRGWLKTATIVPDLHFHLTLSCGTISCRQGRAR